MKNQAIHYLALDVHQATVVASLREGTGKVVMRATVPTEIKAILTMVKSAGPRVYVAFEEGTQAQWLHDGLIDHAERVMVCNVRGRSETTNKSAAARFTSCAMCSSIFTNHPILKRAARTRGARTDGQFICAQQKRP